MSDGKSYISAKNQIALLLYVIRRFGKCKSLAKILKFLNLNKTIKFLGPLMACNAFFITFELLVG